MTTGKVHAQRKFAQGTAIPPNNVNNSERRMDVIPNKEEERSVVRNNTAAKALLDLISFKQIHKHKTPVVLLERLKTNPTNSYSLNEDNEQVDGMYMSNIGVLSMDQNKQSNNIPTETIMRLRSYKRNYRKHEDEDDTFMEPNYRPKPRISRRNIEPVERWDHEQWRSPNDQYPSSNMSDFSMDEDKPLARYAERKKQRQHSSVYKKKGNKIFKKFNRSKRSNRGNNRHDRKRTADGCVIPAHTSTNKNTPVNLTPHNRDQSHRGSMVSTPESSPSMPVDPSSNNKDWSENESMSPIPENTPSLPADPSSPVDPTSDSKDWSENESMSPTLENSPPLPVDRSSPMDPTSYTVYWNENESMSPAPGNNSSLPGGTWWIVPTPSVDPASDSKDWSEIKSISPAPENTPASPVNISPNSKDQGQDESIEADSALNNFNRQKRILAESLHSELIIGFKDDSVQTESTHSEPLNDPPDFSIENESLFFDPVVPAKRRRCSDVNSRNFNKECSVHPQTSEVNEPSTSAAASTSTTMLNNEPSLGCSIGQCVTFSDIIKASVRSIRRRCKTCSTCKNVDMFIQIRMLVESSRYNKKDSNDCNEQERQEFRTWYDWFTVDLDLLHPSSKYLLRLSCCRERAKNNPKPEVFCCLVNKLDSDKPRIEPQYAKAIMEYLHGNFVMFPYDRDIQFFTEHENVDIRDRLVSIDERHSDTDHDESHDNSLQMNEVEVVTDRPESRENSLPRNRVEVITYRFESHENSLPQNEDEVMEPAQNSVDFDLVSLNSNDSEKSSLDSGNEDANFNEDEMLFISLNSEPSNETELLTTPVENKTETENILESANLVSADDNAECVVVLNEGDEIIFQERMMPLPMSSLKASKQDIERENSKKTTGSKSKSSTSGPISQVPPISQDKEQTNKHKENDSIPPKQASAHKQNEIMLPLETNTNDKNNIIPPKQANPHKQNEIILPVETNTNNKKLIMPPKQANPHKQNEIILPVETNTNNKNIIVPTKQANTHKQNEIILPVETNTNNKNIIMPPKQANTHKQNEIILPVETNTNNKNIFIPPKQANPHNQKEIVLPVVPTIHALTHKEDEMILPKQCEIVKPVETNMNKENKTIPPKQANMHKQNQIIPPKQANTQKPTEIISSVETNEEIETVPSKRANMHQQNETIPPKQSNILKQKEIILPNQANTHQQSETIPPKQSNILKQKEIIPPNKANTHQQKESIPPEQANTHQQKESIPPEQANTHTQNRIFLPVATNMNEENETFPPVEMNTSTQNEIISPTEGNTHVPNNIVLPVMTNTNKGAEVIPPFLPPVPNNTVPDITPPPPPFSGNNPIFYFYNSNVNITRIGGADYAPVTTTTGNTVERTTIEKITNTHQDATRGASNNIRPDRTQQTTESQSHIESFVDTSQQNTTHSASTCKECTTIIPDSIASSSSNGQQKPSSTPNKNNLKAPNRTQRQAPQNTNTHTPKMTRTQTQKMAQAQTSNKQTQAPKMTRTQSQKMAQAQARPGNSYINAPVYYPTAEEFKDPIAYFESVEPLAGKYGICKVVPPNNFKPKCNLDDDVIFNVTNQYVTRLYSRWGPGSREMSTIKAYLASQRAPFKRPPLYEGMEVNLPKLYQIVQRHGGLKKVIERKKWGRVAEELRFTKGRNPEKILDKFYVKYLLPYDTLSSSERGQIMSRVERAWCEKYRKLSARSSNPLIREHKILDGCETSDDEEDGEGSDDDPFITGALAEAEECIIQGRKMNLNSYKKVAANAKDAIFPNKASPTLAEVEKEYWRMMLLGYEHLCVISASIDTGSAGYGFTTDENEDYGKHPWNLKNLSSNVNNTLRYLGAVLGVTVPTLHLGMMFSTSCWHKDPHGMPWLDYLHFGASKIWYGIADEQSNRFRKAVEILCPTSCQNKNIWLPSDIAMIPPNLLREQNVTLSRVEQSPGQYVIVFPKAYTCNISAGLTVSESVYFSPSSWLKNGLQFFLDAQVSSEPTMISIESLLLSVIQDSNTPLAVLQPALSLIHALVQKETYNRLALEDELPGESRITAIKHLRHPPGAWNVREQDECEVCRKSLFLSRVRGLTMSNTGICVEHAREIVAHKNEKNLPIPPFELDYFMSIKELQAALKVAESRLFNIS